MSAEFLSKIDDQLQTAVGLVEAAHDLFELDTDEVRDAARYTLEEGVRQLQQIRDDVQGKAINLRVDSRTKQEIAP